MSDWASRAEAQRAERAERRQQELLVESRRAAERSRYFTDLLAQQLQVERLAGDLVPATRCLTLGVAHVLAARPTAPPAVGMIVPSRLEHRRHGATS